MALNGLKTAIFSIWLYCMVYGYQDHNGMKEENERRERKQDHKKRYLLQVPSAGIREEKNEKKAMFSWLFITAVMV